MTPVAFPRPPRRSGSAPNTNRFRSADEPPGNEQPERAEPLRFGCDDCCQRNTSHCEDCLVTHLCSERDGSVVVSMDEMRLVKRLQGAGMVPPNRHRRQII